MGGAAIRKFGLISQFGDFRSKCEKNIEIVISPLINLVKDQVRRLSLLGVSSIALSDISTSAAEVKKVESGEFPKLRIA